MNITKKLICILAAGTALGAAAPSFADSWRGRDHDRFSRFDRFDRYNRFDRFDHRRDFRGPRFHQRDFDRRVVVVERPYVVERPMPMYYPEPAPQQNLSLGGLIGAAVGTIIDQQR
jgi:hypothetical protein